MVEDYMSGAHHFFVAEIEGACQCGANRDAGHLEKLAQV
jgi:hypothetical protein